MSEALEFFPLSSSKKNQFVSIPSLSTESQIIISYSPPWKLCTVFTSMRFLFVLSLPRASSKISLIKSFCGRYGTTTPTEVSLPLEFLVPKYSCAMVAANAAWYKLQRLCPLEPWFIHGVPSEVSTKTNGCSRTQRSDNTLDFVLSPLFKIPP